MKETPSKTIVIFTSSFLACELCTCNLCLALTLCLRLEMMTMLAGMVMRAQVNKAMVVTQRRYEPIMSRFPDLDQKY